MKLCTLLFASLAFITHVQAHDILMPAWSSNSGFKQPESVVYDKASDSLYVSNVDGSPTEFDGKGFISHLDIDGKPIDTAWLEGLNAPKGLAIDGNILYVADINELVAIDISQAKIVNKYKAAQAKFLNDVAVDSEGTVYVSDMMTNQIYRLKDGVFSVWLDDVLLEAPNGLLVEGDSLIVGSWGIMTDGFATETAGHLKTVNLKTGEINSLGNQSPAGNLDGVEADGHGNYLVTDWLNGKLLKIYPSGKSQTLIALNQGSADHTFILEKNLVIIPMMLDDKLLAFEAKK